MTLYQVVVQDEEGRDYVDNLVFKTEFDAEVRIEELTKEYSENGTLEFTTGMYVRDITLVEGK